MAKDRRAEFGPIVSAMAVLSACMALLDPLPTSVPYKAAGRIVVLMAVCVLLLGLWVATLVV